MFDLWLMRIAEVRGQFWPLSQSASAHAQGSREGAPLLVLEAVYTRWAGSEEAVVSLSQNIISACSGPTFSVGVRERAE